MKALIQTGSSGGVPVPPEKRFLINHWRILEAEHKPGRQSGDHPPALRLRHLETGLLEPSTLLRPGSQRRTGRGLGQALPSPRRVPGARSAGGSDLVPGHRRSTGGRSQAAGGRLATLWSTDRRLGSDPWGAGDLHRPAAGSAAHRPAGRLSARRAQHVPAGDGGGVVWAHFDPSLDLLDAMPLLRGESRQRRVVTPVSRPLRLYPDENV